MNGRSCAKCEFMVDPTDGKDGAGRPVKIGFCYRYPPTITVQGNSSAPIVALENTWCGEFSPASRVSIVTRPPKGSRR